MHSGLDLLRVSAFVIRGVGEPSGGAEKEVPRQEIGLSASPAVEGVDALRLTTVVDSTWVA